MHVFGDGLTRHNNPMDKLLIVQLCLLCWLKFGSGSIIEPGCAVDAERCEFYLTLNAHKTMTSYTQTSEFTVFEEPVSVHINGSVIVKERQVCGIDRSLSEEEASAIPMGDGLTKMAYLFNGSLPGPPIVVYKGQELIVHVKNELFNEGISVHWHGIEQQNTPWMDGVESLSQCTINPGETFTYRFQVSRTGTCWYHSHTSTQRTMGAYGPLIILDRSTKEQNKRRADDPLPDIDKEFHLMVSDWFRNKSIEIAQMVNSQAFGFLNGWEVSREECFNSTKAPDGMDAGVLPFQSGLINGKGYRYKSPDEAPINPGIPLERFTVQRGKKYRFRLISTAMTFLFRLSIDGHRLHVISTDGNDVVSTAVDYIIVASGERYDFWIEATNPGALDNYWIRARTLEVYTKFYEKITPNHMEAILQYQESDYDQPVSQPKECTTQSPCVALNCPFKWYGVNYNISCLSVSQLQSAEQGHHTMKSLKPEKGSKRPSKPKFVEIFLNYHAMLKFKSESTEVWTETINGRKNTLPGVPLQIYPETEADQMKPCRCPYTVFCSCTNMVEIPLGSTVQLVLFVTVKNPPGTYNGNPHNAHLHGYRFQVIKTGYAIYETNTSFPQNHSGDIHCLDEFCNEATWSNRSWSGGHVPRDVDRGPYKDTVLIPVGGYTVVQFTANNPGYWYMHCHTEFHNEEGMSMVLKVGDISEMPPAPSHMARCGNPDWSSHTFDKSRRVLLRRDTSIEIDINCRKSTLSYRIVILILVAATLILLALNAYTCYEKRNSLTNGYMRLPPSQND